MAPLLFVAALLAVGSQAPSSDAATGPLDAAGAMGDTEPPTIEDLAVAAANPSAPPMITAVFSDDVSGVRLAEVFYRKPGEASFERAEFQPGSSGIFIARLPDGLQRTGFEYYVEVVDAAGNPPARLGSPERPLAVGRAVESTAARLARQRVEAEVGPSIHPAWTMAALGAGLLGAAGSGIFWVDWFVLQGQIADIDEQLGSGGLSDAARGSLEVARAQRANAQLQDATVGSILAVAGAAGLATGITLLTLTALE